MPYDKNKANADNKNEFPNKTKPRRQGHFKIPVSNVFTLIKFLEKMLL